MKKTFISHFRSKKIYFEAFKQSFLKLNPLVQWKNPVMLITEIGALITTFAAFYKQSPYDTFTLNVAAWLWFTVLFGNFAESIAELKNSAQASGIQVSMDNLKAHKMVAGKWKLVEAATLREHDVIRVKAGEVIPLDGEIIKGVASIDESSITGETEPVIKASGTDQNSVIAGCRVVSDELEIRITANPGEGFIDDMIKTIDSMKRRKAPSDVALTTVFVGLYALFIVMVGSLQVFAHYHEVKIPLVMQVALLICLIPTTIAGLLSAIGISGINRLLDKKILALSGSAVESAGDINTLIFDKTGTLTEGTRHAHELICFNPEKEKEFLEACYYTSCKDETSEGKSILEILTKKHRLKPKQSRQLKSIPFSAEMRMSGADYAGYQFRKGSKEAIEKFSQKKLSRDQASLVEEIASQGGTPLVVASNDEVLGVVYLKDVLKEGLVDKFEHFRNMGIKTVLLTGDHELTAKAITEQLHLDDYVANCTPEEKMKFIKKLHKKGDLVAMAGDGVNDALALAEADVAIAMHAGTQAAKGAANVIDLDSHPNKIFDVIQAGKQMLMTRGSLTTFSIANDIAKYFAIIPAMLIPYFPFFEEFNIMKLKTPQTAVLSAVIFNALVLVCMIPLSSRGVKFVTKDPRYILNRNLVLFGIGGIFIPFFGIKLIDIVLNILHVT